MKNKKNRRVSIASGHIGHDMKINGTVTSEHGYDLRGEIFNPDGLAVDTKGRIIVHEKALIVGDIKAGELTVYGSVQGDIDVVGAVSVTEEATLIGDVRAGAVDIRSNYCGKITVGKYDWREAAQ